MKTRLTTLLPAALCLVLSSCGADGLKTIDIARGLRTDSYSVRISVDSHPGISVITTH